MSDTFYKPLTPSMRNNINNAIDRNIAELDTCQENAFVNVQKIGQQVLKNLINALPDGYPLPMKKCD
ncbi:MAG: hypothetical protein J6C37_06135 [Roseburia sp.]|jgi:hypothetical protein|nr:hypothetical protein [Roseburia sp.]